MDFQERITVIEGAFGTFLISGLCKSRVSASFPYTLSEVGRLRVTRRLVS